MGSMPVGVLGTIAGKVVQLNNSGLAIAVFKIVMEKT